MQYFNGNHKAIAPLVTEMKEKLEGIARDGSEVLEQIHESEDRDKTASSSQ